MSVRTVLIVAALISNCHPTPPARRKLPVGGGPVPEELIAVGL
jgi:hypothetical protein